MTYEDLVIRVARAIQFANKDHPNVGDGTTRPDHIMSNEESLFLAHVALKAVHDAGCITDVDIRRPDQA